MRKKLSIISAMLVVLLAIAGVTLAPASADDNGDDHTRTINLTTKTAQEADLDLGKQGLSLGDRFVFSDDVFEDGKQVGTDGGECTIVRLDPANATEQTVKAITVQCVVTLSLEEGQITGQGLITFANAPEPFTVAITGGTGEFRTAHGEVQVTEESEDVSRLTVKLIL